MNTNKKTTKVKQSQRFFGEEIEIKNRFIFVEELSEIYMKEGDEKKNLYLEIQAYDSSKNEFEKEKVVVAFNQNVYNELLSFLLKTYESELEIKRLKIQMGKQNAIKNLNHE